MKCNCKHLEARAIELFGELEKAKAQIIADDSEILWQGNEIADLMRELADCDKKYKNLARLNTEFKQIIARQNDNECEQELSEVREDRAAKTLAIIQLHRKIAELREAVDWYFECASARFYMNKKYNNVWNHPWNKSGYKYMERTIKHAEQALRAMIGGDE